MGTMLAQKKPLESIQRSQAINFVAEIFYDELQFILDRRLLDHTMVNCHGMNSRVKSRDVLSVSVQHIAATNADKEYILLNLARNSIYHQLPELLFHPLVLSTPGMSNKEIVEAIRANEKQDKELIQFFAPFDTEFFDEKDQEAGGQAAQQGQQDDKERIPEEHAPQGHLHGHGTPGGRGQRHVLHRRGGLLARRPGAPVMGAHVVQPQRLPGVSGQRVAPRLRHGRRRGHGRGHADAPHE